MKVSKGSAKRLNAIRKALTAGKTLGGLLAGFAAAAFAGGCREHSPAVRMGSYPNPEAESSYEQQTKPQQENSVREQKAPSKSASHRKSYMMGKYPASSDDEE